MNVKIEFIGRAGFHAIYEQYKDIVFQVACMYIKNWHMAEDITQEAFLRYYIYMEHTKIDNAKSWLITTTKNIALNYKRDMKRETPIDTDEYGEEYLGVEQSGETLVFRKMWNAEVVMSTSTILDALYRKNRRWYDAVTLVYCMEKPQKDVAECMGINMDTLYSMLYRAKNWIKKNYRSEYEQIYEA